VVGGLHCGYTQQANGDGVATSFRRSLAATARSTATVSGPSSSRRSPTGSIAVTAGKSTVALYRSVSPLVTSELRCGGNWNGAPIGVANVVPSFIGGLHCGGDFQTAMVVRQV
jgi:hypothetical protein